MTPSNGANDFCLAIDLGTTSLKVAVVGSDGSIAALASRPLTTRFVNAGVEQDANQWWAHLVSGVHEVLAVGTVTPSRIRLITCTAQYMSLVPVAADGCPVGPVLMWMDDRGASSLAHLRSRDMRSLWREHHGLAPFGSDDLAHLSFLQAEMPQVYDAAVSLVEPVDALTARLVGFVSANQNTAFPLLLTDNRTLGTVTYDDELVGLAGVDPAKLASLVPIGAILGTLCRPAAQALGLAPHTQVVSGTIDSVTSAIGTAAIAENRCGLVIGTTSVVVAHARTKRIDPVRSLFTAPSGLPGRYVLLAENGVGGKAIEQVGALLSLDPAALLGAAANSPPGSNGVRFLPWLVGSMAPQPNPHARGGFLGLSLSTTTSDLCRAAVEGVALNVAGLLPEVESFLGDQYSSLTFGGGGASSPLWAQVLADACQRPVARVSKPRATNARGAALLAFAHAGLIPFEHLGDRVPLAEIHYPDRGLGDLYAAARNSLRAALDQLPPSPPSPVLPSMNQTP